MSFVHHPQEGESEVEGERDATESFQSRNETSSAQITHQHSTRVGCTLLKGQPKSFHDRKENSSVASLIQHGIF